MIRAWLAARAEARRLRQYKRGWDYAAGRLLEGVSFPEVIGFASTGLFFDPLPYDQGIMDACRAWAVPQAMEWKVVS